MPDPSKDADESDLCGAETVAGNECKNLATEGDSCWIPSHKADQDPETDGGTDVDNPGGRPPAITDDDHDAILESAHAGLSKAGCARAAGASRDSLNRYLEKNPEFRAAFMRARNAGEQTLVTDGLRDDDVDSSMAKFLLASSYDYKKTETREHTGEGGGPLQLEINETVHKTGWSEGEDPAGGSE